MRTKTVGVVLAAAAALAVVGLAAAPASAAPTGGGAYSILVTGYGPTEAIAAYNAELAAGYCEVISPDHFTELPDGTYSDTLKAFCSNLQVAR